MRDRFMSFVDAQPDGCWVWRGGRDKDGYGIFSGERGRSRRAHRVSWELHVGPIPQGLWVLHRCDRPYCVRPEHLFVGTASDNRIDCVRKGRQGAGYVRLEPACVGALHGQAKLSEDDVRQIRALLSEGRMKQREIAKIFGVTQSTISNISKGKRWRHSGSAVERATARAGGWLRGSSHGAAKLSEADVQEIRRRRAQGHSQKSIAHDYGVSAGTISGIDRRRTWAHL